MTDKYHVVLIGGIPGVGKSSISGYIARELGIDIVLSGDYLREFLRGSCQENTDLLGVSVYDSWQLFGIMNRENIVKGYLEQGKIITRGINAILKRAISNGESVIVETLYFLPSLIGDDILKNITPLYLYISDKKINEARLLERTKYTHLKSSGERLARQLDTYRVMMDYSLEECKRFGIKTFDNTDYIKTRESMLRYLSGGTDG
ncbi:AAA family ATPase [Thermoplasmatales archaeon AK]|nr:AAA family ATPase [Thermoplasmatales archaeon AK]